MEKEELISRLERETSATEFYNLKEEIIKALKGEEITEPEPQPEASPEPEEKTETETPEEPKPGEPEPQKEE